MSAPGNSVGWVEKRVALERAAIAWLRHRGFAVTRLSDGVEYIARYQVDRARNPFDFDRLVAFARQMGFAE
ncbi:MAG: hypothetical protein OSB00_17975 [Sphingomonas bacterium]|nr:hypothetical protein [Sphingomonas bacterium]